ncbi:histone H3.3 [Iris pallida]|uniref:Histone H3.3 n=1 Tax=Iris pallida TaxID=29817 RepID=A0AAX6IAG5_IRIPA|nr:histone H3.3 [Iris pallida]
MGLIRRMSIPSAVSFEFVLGQFFVLNRWFEYDPKGIIDS